MAKFSFGEHLTQASEVISAKLGATNAKMVDADVGFPVKLTADSLYSKCADSNEIEGFVKSIEPFNVQDSSFGGVQLGGFKEVNVYGAIAIGDYVVAETLGRVKKTATAPASLTFLWRYVSGAVGVGATTVYAGVIQRIR